MGDSLQDQLRALGLARSKPKKEKSRQKTSKTGPIRDLDRSDAGKGFSLEKAYAAREREERKQSRRKRAARHAEDLERRRINSEIRKIVMASRLNSPDAEIARNFMYRGRIRKLQVTAGQLKALNDGELGIAYLSGGYHLLAPEQLEAVRRLSPEHVVELECDADDDDDDHPVPDDLRW